MRGRRGSRSAAVVLAGCVGLAVVAPGLALAAPISGVTPAECQTAGGTWTAATGTCDDGATSGSTTGGSGSSGSGSTTTTTTTTPEQASGTAAGSGTSRSGG